MVREGDMPVEAVLLQRTKDGRYRTVGADAEIEFAAEDHLSVDQLPAVMASTIRIPPSILSSAVLELDPLPGWANSAWLSKAHALILDTEGRNSDLTIDRKGAQVPLEISYSRTLGLGWTIRPRE